MELELLADHERAIPIVANWYFEKWGHLREGNTLDKITESLGAYLNTDKIPLMVLALEAGEILGAVQLKYREMDIFPDRVHWLGGVYVSKDHRGKNIAEKMIGKLVSIAEKLGVHTLYLQTAHPDGGLYRHLGWKPVEKVNYHGLNVLVMEKDLGV